MRALVFSIVNNAPWRVSAPPINKNLLPISKISFFSGGVPWLLAAKVKPSADGLKAVA